MDKVPEKNSNSVAQSIRFNSLVLGIFALVTAFLLAITYSGTKDTIAHSERVAAQKNLLEIFPPAKHNNDLLEDTLPIPAPYLTTLGLKKPADIHVARLDGVATGFIVPAVAPDGYSGEIHLLVGLTTNGTVAGVRVTAHNETPGLGDKVDLRKSPWVLSFTGKSLGNPKTELWGVKKDKGYFDQFTGATITPRAVVAQVKRVLLFYKEHHKELLRAANPSTPETVSVGDQMLQKPLKEQDHE